MYLSVIAYYITNRSLITRSYIKSLLFANPLITQKYTAEITLSLIFIQASCVQYSEHQKEFGGSESSDLYSYLNSKKKVANSVEKRMTRERDITSTLPTTLPASMPAVTHTSQPHAVDHTTQPAAQQYTQPSFRPQPDTQGKAQLARLYKQIQEQIKKSHSDQLKSRAILDQQARIQQEINQLREEVRRRRDDQGKGQQELRAREEVMQLRETLAELRKDKGRFHSTKQNIEKARAMEMVVLCEKQLKSRQEQISQESNKNSELSSQIQGKYDNIRSYSAKISLYQQEINLLNSELDKVDRQANQINSRSIQKRKDRPNFDAERFEALVQQRMDLQNDLQRCKGRADEKRRREITNSIEALTHLIDSMKRGH